MEIFFLKWNVTNLRSTGVSIEIYFALIVAHLACNQKVQASSRDWTGLNSDYIQFKHLSIFLK